MSTVNGISKALVTSPQNAKVNLVPWDPESIQHVQRLYDQRVTCGWKMDKVEKWRVMQREGKIAIHWMIVSEDEPERESKLAHHVTQHVNEKVPLLDTGTSLAGKPRSSQRLSQPFIPVGHISLDFYNEDPSLADPSEGIYYISTFYVSRALQGGGLGRAAMDAIERMAIEPPLNAKVLALDTLAREQALDDEFWKDEDLIGQKPKMSNEDWYARRGYKVLKRDERFYVEFSPSGRERMFTAVFMRKTIGYDLTESTYSTRHAVEAMKGAS